ncbi:DNA polymerase III subunit gamma and tau [Paenarthrobacter aromaticivorans]|uniref:DNA polymerase III subunit gamma and tau n=1 Tax=Paenarthrobacter aromaticivorans TaxID=2849150 RepID=UPI003A7F86A3
MTVTTALYRRYRPDSFADVIGQEHVTEPLMTALRKNRVNHAYLFSGPRGCGKTTSARILARCLNCAEGPTDTPCGKCPSCIELARGGSGSLDVIEIDAASHGGVDDARDLRERATFAPVRDRYKIFIIDEAHMVTSAGFNALLKIVEEPPEHIKFIFATTEPDKVIGTIRSRTHHYPFRLVPPEPLMKYLELLCHQENVPVAPGVLSLVIRAGGGSVRDTLSVLDQLMAGAGPNGLDYELAVALLGYTHASLLDDVVDAVAAADSSTVFRAVDRVIQTGHDPRRFVEDLLERFRDLIIVQAMPESAQAILRGVPEDQIARMRNQATNLGAAELSRAADVTNTALTEMTGATSPRLHLELLCARILLPSSEQTERGIAARIDRVERRLNYAGDAGIPAAASGTASAVASSPASASAAAPVAQSAPAQAPTASVSVAAAAPAPAPVQAQAPAPAPVQEPAPAPVQAPAPVRETSSTPVSREQLSAPRITTNDWPVDEPAATQRPVQDAPSTKPPAATVPPAAPQPAPQTAPASQMAPASQPAPASTPAPAAGGDVEALRRAWPEVLQTLTKIKRSTWALVEPNAQVAQFDGQVLTLAFTTGGLAGAFGRADHSENLRQAIHKTIGIDCQIVAVAGANSSASSEPNPKAPTSRNVPESPGTAAPSAAPGATHVPAPAPKPASSVDSAWGLAPAAPEAATPVPTKPETAAPNAATPIATITVQAEPATPAPSIAASAPVAPHREAAVPAAAPEPSRPKTPGSNFPATPAPSPAPATEAAAPRVETPAPTQEPAGDYAYPDEDWGPPLDEDAPPLDEEPPMDWEPSPAFSASNSTPAPASGERQATSGSSLQTREPHAAATSATAATTSSQPSASQDPWSRAVEQAPGTWVVGTESNVGAKPQSPVEPDTGAPDVPAYEPAAAQVPAPDVVGTPAPATTSYGHASSGGQNGSSGWDVAPASTWPGTIPAQAGTQAPAAWPITATETQHAGGSVATLEEGTPSSGPSARQSLYQRLTNSPEAQAGRVQAPVRTQARPEPAPEDIPSPEDETIEESRVFGRAAVERILGGKLIEERALDGSPLQPR